MNGHIHWEEPNVDGTQKKCSITFEQAILIQRAVGKRHHYHYTSDEEALEDFITNHWAWKEDE